MTAAERSRRYRAKRKAARDAAAVMRDADDVPLDVLERVLSELCDSITITTDPADVIAGWLEEDLRDLAMRAEMCSAWLGALATLADASIKRARP